ncbi:phospholipase D-like domain-containing protein [Cobetia sp. MMG027]|uniref:phospholipase D-like domain-containing protein n=1 Tax=Cobetia sp. MMG027 TaxID=3021980 RepID=UPI0022FE81CD|nr:phospholipase D-like domain-containing protein [Cobetia sp. MMG027]MDA5562337.1 phospholipase D-like domain-containing protein [Cobetia sp. MMG027]
MDNLNNYQLDNDGNFDKNFVDNSVSTAGVSVYFRDIEKKLLQHISEADAVFGAVAWLTSDLILDALSQVNDVSIVIQKEDFLRPDFGVNNNWKNKLREKYDALSCSLTRYSFDNILNSVSVCSDPSLDSVRCVGNHNRDKKPAFPRMHNKFLVFAKIDGTDEHGNEIIKPYAVWTGSFNLTRNASMSLENALYLTEPKIVKAYYDEFGQIAAMSEELDWTSDWAAPEWRIGT